MGTVFCPMARVTSIAYESRNGPAALALKAPQPTLEELTALCLNHLAQDPDQLAEFMAISGLSPADLRGAAADGSLARGLLDYVVQNEPLLLAICQGASLSPEAVMRVWARLNPAG